MLKINIKELKPKEWQPIRKRLEEALKDTWSFTRISRISSDNIAIEGGELPIEFNLSTKECYVWGRCSRHSHGYINISELIKLKAVLINWIEKEQIL